jgi:transposase
MAKSKKGKRLSMRKIREILRLGMKGDLSRRQIARSCGVSRPAVSTYLDRVQTSGHAYEEIEKMTDQEITALMKPQTVSKSESGKPQADWKWVHQEMKKKGVTLALLWNEYKDEYPEGYQYTQYCAYYKGWIRKLAVSLRQSYKAGEKMFVDYAGHTIPVVDPKTGYTRDAQIFVAVLGASNYTYVEATWDQSLESWIDSHVHAFEYFNGVTEIVVPDNLRSGVSKACRYEPDLNPTYHEMAVHYGTVIMPTRVRKPKRIDSS